MTTIEESVLINKLATDCAEITGVEKAYQFASNPDNLVSAFLPAVVFFPSGFSAEPKGHFNQWRNELSVRGILFVAERMARGGRLKYLENAAMPFATLFRQKFQTASVIEGLLGLHPGLTKAWLTDGEYGAGGNLLTYNGKPYIGWVFTWNFLEIN